MTELERKLIEFLISKDTYVDIHCPYLWAAVKGIVDRNPRANLRIGQNKTRTMVAMTESEMPGGAYGIDIRVSNYTSDPIRVVTTIYNEVDKEIRRGLCSWGKV